MSLLLPKAELLNGEIFYTLKEAQVLIEAWRRHYNAIRPHSSLGYRPPAPETIVMPSWTPGSAPPAIQLGRETINALTFELDQSVGAGHSRPGIPPWVTGQTVSRNTSTAGCTFLADTPIL